MRILEKSVVGQGSSELKEEGFPSNIIRVSDETKVECRICQEEDLLDKMESPCACKGTIQFAHKSCLQKWCNEKQNIYCEICHQKYHPNYTIEVPPLPHIIPCLHHTVADIISEGWAFSGNPHDAQLEALTLFPQAGHESNNCIHAILGGSRTCHFLIFAIQLALCCIAGLVLAIVVLTGKSNPDRNRSHEYTVYYIAFGMIVPCYVMAGVSNFMRFLRERSNRRDRDDEFGIVVAISPRSRQM